MIKLLASCCFFLVVVSAFSQHNEFQSLYMYDALLINPAYAGNKGALTLNSNYRDQWGGLKGSPKTLSVSAHLLTKSQKTGIGFSVLNDRFGILNNLKVNAVYAYKIKMKRNELSLGLAGGIRNQSIDLSALSLNNADDATYLTTAQHSILPDFSVGALFKNDHFLFGITAPNIVRIHEKSTFQSLNGYFSTLLTMNPSLKLKPSVLVKYVAHSPVAYEGNLTAYYGKAVSFGVGLRSDKTSNAHVRLQLNRQFGVAYLYERNLGPMRSLMKNTHEIMLNYIFDFQTNVQSPRYL